MSVVQELLTKIQKQIDSTNLNDSRDEKGEVIAVKDGVATISGLNKAKFSEIIVFESGIKGLVLDLDVGSIGALILGAVDQVNQGMSVQSTGQVFSIGVGEGYLGRVVDGLGNPIDGLGDIKTKETYPVERIAPGVMTRKSVHQPLQTGIKAIDCMIPIGKGQRELII